MFLTTMAAPCTGAPLGSWMRTVLEPPSGGAFTQWLAVAPHVPCAPCLPEPAAIPAPAAQANRARDGLNATDAWQLGRSAMVPDVLVLGDVSTRDSRIGLFLREPSAQWHAELSSANTGTALTSDNLPRPVTRGALHQSEHLTGSRGIICRPAVRLGHGSTCFCPALDNGPRKPYLSLARDLP
jgi:hypothetical protein